MTSINRFNPDDWLDNPSSSELEGSIGVESASEQPSQTSKEIEQIIYQLEAQKIDLAPNYDEWRNIGFAFADEFGEKGRELYHRVSSFYSDYSETACNRQYDNCLKSGGAGVSLGTFYHLAKKFGLEMPRKERREKNERAMLPTFSADIYESLPDFFQRVVKPSSSEEERDVFLLGSIAVVSSCMSNLTSQYGGNKVYPNLFLFVTGSASSGKGNLNHCKRIVKPIHDEIRAKSKAARKEYELECSELNSKKSKQTGSDLPEKPPLRMLFIPANNSSTGFFQNLAENDEQGLIFETEGDTLAQAFKTDFGGDFSNGFRKAFHHEPISYFRRTNDENVEIDEPRLSAVLSGTPNQVLSLIPSAENGLFSRFMFYHMNMKPEWKDVFSNNGKMTFNDHFDSLGSEFQMLHKQMTKAGNIEFTLTESQKSRFNNFFKKVQADFLDIQGPDYIATVRRLGLIAFRISMVLSVVRKAQAGELPKTLICEEQDFQTALSMIDTLLVHSGEMFNRLPKEKTQMNYRNRKEKFLAALPSEFNRQDYLSIAQKLSIPDKTAERYITQACKKGFILRDRQNEYRNPAAEETEDDEETEDR